MFRYCFAPFNNCDPIFHNGIYCIKNVIRTIINFHTTPPNKKLPDYTQMR